MSGRHILNAGGESSRGARPMMPVFDRRSGDDRRVHSVAEDAQHAYERGFADATGRLSAKIAEAEGRTAAALEAIESEMRSAERKLAAEFREFLDAVVAAAAPALVEAGAGAEIRMALTRNAPEGREFIVSLDESVFSRALVDGCVLECLSEKENILTETNNQKIISIKWKNGGICYDPLKIIEEIRRCISHGCGDGDRE